MITIIMPVYNITGRRRIFLSAVRSVVRQTHRDWELLLVNDGSTDDSLSILHQLETAEKRIRVFHKQNGGVESARRYGLANAQGDYIMHMDQDDMYRQDALALLLQRMTEEAADVAVANRLRFILSRHLTFGQCKTPSMQTWRTLSHDEFMHGYYQSFFGINDLPVNIWNKMYRKSFLDSIPEPPLTGCILEDLSYNMHVLPYAKHITILPDNLYFYRWGGYTNGYDKTILQTALTGYRLKMEQIRKWDLPQTFRTTTAIELLNYLNSHFSNIVTYDGTNRSTFIQQAEHIFDHAEVTEGCQIVADHNKYHREHIDAMLDRDFNRLYDHEVAVMKANREKLFIKKILLRM